jgi:hypothetical protein
MDKEFMKFWGNFLLNAAQGQEQFENMTQWMQQGFKGFEDLNTLFRKAYGLEQTAPQPANEYLENWKKAQESFTQSFKDFCSAFGFVPKDDHLALVKKYEGLKLKVESQEETIKHLRMLLAQAGAAEQDAVTTKLNDLMSQQTEQFQKLMEGFGRMFDKEQSSD